MSRLDKDRPLAAGDGPRALAIPGDASGRGSGLEGERKDAWEEEVEDARAAAADEAGSGSGLRMSKARRLLSLGSSLPLLLLEAPSTVERKLLGSMV